MTFLYTGDPSASDVAAVRFELQDTDSAAPLLQDEEIAWCILQETTVAAAEPATIAGANLFRSAARAMESLSRLFAAQADTQVGSLKVTYKDQAQNYAERAAKLRAKAADLNAPTAPAIDRSFKRGRADDADAVQPLFRRGQFDNPWAATPDLPDLGPPFGDE